MLCTEYARVCCMFQYYLHYSYLINARPGPCATAGAEGPPPIIYDVLGRPTKYGPRARTVVGPFKNAVVVPYGLSALHAADNSIIIICNTAIVMFIVVLEYSSAVVVIVAYDLKTQYYILLYTRYDMCVCNIIMSPIIGVNIFFFVS